MYKVLLFKFGRHLCKGSIMVFRLKVTKDKLVNDKTKNNCGKRNQKYPTQKLIFPILFFNIDIDECWSRDTNNCHQHADCHNTDGSFNCTCKRGFTGNGTECQGIHRLKSEFKESYLTTIYKIANTSLKVHLIQSRVF